MLCYIHKQELAACSHINTLICEEMALSTKNDENANWYQYWNTNGITHWYTAYGFSVFNWLEEKHIWGDELQHVRSNWLTKEKGVNLEISILFPSRWIMYRQNRIRAAQWPGSLLFHLPPWTSHSKWASTFLPGQREKAWKSRSPDEIKTGARKWKANWNSQQLSNNNPTIMLVNLTIRGNHS